LKGKILYTICREKSRDSVIPPELIHFIEHSAASSTGGVLEETGNRTFSLKNNRAVTFDLDSTVFSAVRTAISGVDGDGISGRV
jgi:hypothetical protein